MASFETTDSFKKHFRVVEGFIGEEIQHHEIQSHLLEIPSLRSVSSCGQITLTIGSICRRLQCLMKSSDTVAVKRFFNESASNDFKTK